MHTRKPNHPVLPLLVDRWSSRAMSGEMIAQQELMSLFEAARWAPSSYNNQPWRFIYALKNTPAWDKMFSLLGAFNKEWAHAASVLILVLSHKNFAFNHKPSRTHALDTGAATQNLALQGYSMGLVVHGMEGFDYERARAEFAILEDYTIEAMYAVGKPGAKHELPLKLQEREFQSDRKSVEDLISPDLFRQSWLSPKRS